MVEGRWSDEVRAALPDGEILFSRGRIDYQGSVAIIARLDDGRWLQYDWSYGSCSGCDQWEGERETVIADEIRRGAAIMDAHTFQDFLAGILHRKAEWLLGTGGYGSYEDHTGLEVEELLNRVKEDL